MFVQKGKKIYIIWKNFLIVIPHNGWKDTNNVAWRSYWERDRNR